MAGNIITGYNREKEVNEAIRAGRRALDSLNGAENYLKSARGWGVMDLLGGNFITGMFKHSRISSARNELEMARSDLRIFQQELTDIRDMPELSVNIGEFLTFADFFFDGFIADVMVQAKINNALNKVREARRRTEGILSDLEAARIKR